MSNIEQLEQLHDNTCDSTDIIIQDNIVQKDSNFSGKHKKLSDRQKRFADLYLGECAFNATEACIKAGYKIKDRSNLTKKAHSLKKSPAIAEYLEFRQKQLESDSIIASKELQEFLTSCIRGKKTEPYYFVLREGEKGKFKDTIVKKDLPYKAKDRLKAIEIMCKINHLTDDNKSEKPIINIINTIPKDL